MCIQFIYYYKLYLSARKHNNDVKENTPSDLKSKKKNRR